jgi:hypothetical protein
MISPAGSWSVSEASSLAIKAARGVGMPWGIAEEAGFALRWLTQSGAPGVTAMCRYLSAYQDAMKISGADSSSETARDWICPLRLGTAISDGGIALPLEQPNVREPLLLLPFLASRATDNQSVVLEMGVIRIIISANVFSANMVETALLVSKAECTIDFEPANRDGIKQIGERVNPTASECMATLNRFAHKTYAPATEASRLAGAGAGLNDND